MSSVVLDASAVLAFLRREPGGELVQSHLRGSRLCAVNYVEVLAKSAEIGIGGAQVESTLSDVGVERVPFDDSHAYVTAALRPSTRQHGLSLADRACLALATVMKLPMMTADRRWAECELQLDIRLIR